MKTILQMTVTADGEVTVTNYSFYNSVRYMYKNESCYWIQDKIDDYMLNDTTEVMMTIH